MQEKQIKIGKNNINYIEFVDTRNSYNLLVLHGWGGSSNSWIDFGKILFESSSYNIIIPDLPGFGKTKLDKIYNLEDYAILIEKFLDKLNLKNIILMGHSNGGAISIILENRGIIKVDHLVLNNSAGIRNDKKRKLKRIIFNSLSKIFKKLNISKNGFLRKMFYKLIGSNDYIISEKSQYLKETYLNMINSDLTKQIQNIDKNTLLIWGEKDNFTPISDGIKMRKLIKNSKLIILDKQKHSIHLNNVNLLINTFLNNI